MWLDFRGQIFMIRFLCDWIWVLINTPPLSSFDHVSYRASSYTERSGDAGGESSRRAVMLPASRWDSKSSRYCCTGFTDSEKEPGSSLSMLDENRAQRVIGTFPHEKRTVEPLPQEAAEGCAPVRGAPGVGILRMERMGSTVYQSFQKSDPSHFHFSSRHT